MKKNENKQIENNKQLTNISLMIYMLFMINKAIQWKQGLRVISEISEILERVWKIMEIVTVIVVHSDLMVQGIVWWEMLCIQVHVIVRVCVYVCVGGCLSM